MSEAQIFFAEPSNLYRDQTDEHDVQVVFFADYIALAEQALAAYRAQSTGGDGGDIQENCIRLDNKQQHRL